MHEISTTPMRKALGVMTYRSSHIDVKLHESSGRSQSLTVTGVATEEVLGIEEGFGTEEEAEEDERRTGGGGG